MSTIEKPLVSVVVPVYNVAKYLQKCLESILRQTLSTIEIIVIDDGSTDNSLEVAQSIAMTDKRVTVYHKDNGGLSSARNYGIDRSTTDLITFVDSDDYLDDDMIEILYHGIKKNNADISMCTLYDVYPGKQPKQNEKIEEYVVDGEQAIKIVLEANITSVYAVAKLYKKELFNTVRYPVGKIAEDAFVIVKLLDQCNRVYITNERKYYYIHRENSITTSEFSMKNCDVIEAYKNNLSYVEEKYPALIKTAQMRVCWANFFVLDKLATTKQSNKQIEDEIVSFLRSRYFFILQDPCFTKGRKFAMSTLMLSRRLYKYVAKKYILKRGVYS